MPRGASTQPIKWIHLGRTSQVRPFFSLCDMDAVCTLGILSVRTTSMLQIVSQNLALFAAERVTLTPGLNEGAIPR